MLLVFLNLLSRILTFSFSTFYSLLRSLFIMSSILYLYCLLSSVLFSYFLFVSSVVFLCCLILYCAFLSFTDCCHQLRQSLTIRSFSCTRLCPIMPYFSSSSFCRSVLKELIRSWTDWFLYLARSLLSWTASMYLFSWSLTGKLKRLIVHF